MKNKKDHHYSMLIGVFVLVVLAAAIIFMTQFNAQVGEAARMTIKQNTLGSPQTPSNVEIITPDRTLKTEIIRAGQVSKPDYSGWEEAWKKGLLVDPGYDGLPSILEGFDNIIIINDGEEKPRLVLYDPRWQKDIDDLFKKKPHRPTQPVPPSLEELGRIKRSGSWTCYYDENGNFVRAWKTSRNGQNVEINEDPDGSHKCPKTTEVKTPAPSLPPPIVGGSDGTINEN